MSNRHQGSSERFFPVRFRWVSAPLAWLVLSLPLVASGEQRTISRELLRDKIRGGWAGQMIGVAYGASDGIPLQCTILEGELSVEGRHAREHDPSGRPVRRDDVLASHGRRGSGCDLPGLWKGLSGIQVSVCGTPTRVRVVR